jgi:hypothetical protein
MNFPFYLQIILFKKSKTESGPEEMIQTEILVEWVIKIVETHYWLKFKKKSFAALIRIDNPFRFKTKPYGFDFYKNWIYPTIQSLIKPLNILDKPGWGCPKTPFRNL